MSNVDADYIACLFKVVFQNESVGYLEPLLLIPGILEDNTFNVCGKVYPSCDVINFRELNGTFIYGFPLHIFGYLQNKYINENGLDDDLDDEELDHYMLYYSQYYEEVCQNYQDLIMKNTYSFYIDKHENVHVVQMNVQNKELCEINLLRSYYQDRMIATGSSKLYILYPGR